ncbi:MAG: hypothetical protein JEZ03_17165 [Bacteroidales bacterium]|nr:hypothetical protein [Bacteroidales bacterium]
MNKILKFFVNGLRWIAFLVVTLVLLYLLYFLIIFLTGFAVNLKLIWLISLLSLIAFLFYWFNQLILLGIAFLVSYISPNKKKASIYFSLLIVSFGVFTLFEYWKLDIIMIKKIVFELFLVSIWGTLFLNSIISYKTSKIYDKMKGYDDYLDESVYNKPEETDIHPKNENLLEQNIPNPEGSHLDNIPPEVIEAKRKTGERMHNDGVNIVTVTDKAKSQWNILEGKLDPQNDGTIDVRTPEVIGRKIDPETGELGKSDPLPLNSVDWKTENVQFELASDYLANEVAQIKRNLELENTLTEGVLNMQKRQAEQEGLKTLTIEKDGEETGEFVVRPNEDGSDNIGEIYNTENKAMEVAKALSIKYPNSAFDIINQTDPSNPFAKGQFIIKSTPINKTL